MLADSVEASSRTLTDPTPSVIRAHVSKIMKDVYADGQLDNCDLTFRDLSRIADAFVSIITGLHHQRITYPGQDKNGIFAPEDAEDLKPEWMVEGADGSGGAPAAQGPAGDTGTAGAQGAEEGKA